MIQLTVFSGEKQTINPDKIIRIGDHDEKGVIGAHIQFIDDKFLITKETRQEVARKVLEYKLATIQLTAAQSESVKHHGDPVYLSNVYESTLKSLAGLEDTHD